MLDVPCYWKCNLISCWNYKIYLYDNIHNISWELVNKFEINQMNTKYEKKTLLPMFLSSKKTCLINF
jgi:hypothetical protein